MSSGEQMTELDIKGQAFRTTLQVIHDLFGSEIEQRLVESLSDDFRIAVQTGTLVVSGWYPASWYRELYDGLYRLLPHEAEIPRQIGRATTERDLDGIYRFILRLTSPELLARHFDKVLHSYFRGGELAVDVGEGCLVLNTIGWFGFSKPMVEEAAAGCEFLVERTGVQIVNSELREIAAGAYRFELQWVR